MSKQTEKSGALDQLKPLLSSNGSRLQTFVTLLIFTLLAAPLLLLPQFDVYFDRAAGFHFLENTLVLGLVAVVYIATAFAMGSMRISLMRKASICIAYLVVFVVVVWLVADSPIDLPRIAGAPAIYLFFANGVALLFGLLVFAGPWLVVAAIVLVLALPFIRDTNHTFDQVTNIPNKPDYNKNLAICDLPKGQYVGCYFLSWLNGRKDLDAYRKARRPYPVYLVTAAGGGIYAAAHTYAFLEEMTARCPSFRQHIFAISSVSGGSFGAIHYATNNNIGRQISDLPECGPSVGPGDDKLTADYFSPILASFIFSNLVEFFLLVPTGVADSGSTLEAVMTKTLGSPLLKQPIESLWKADGSMPALFINITDVESGRSVYSAPFDFLTAAGDVFYGTTTGNIGGLRNIDEQVSISTATSLSARFPFITPTARAPKAVNQEEDEDQLVPARYADGGYVDNGGAYLIRHLYERLVDNENFEMPTDDCDHLQGEEQSACLETGEGRKTTYSGCVEADHSTFCKYSIDGSSDDWDKQIVPIQIKFVFIDVVAREEEGSPQRAIDPLKTLLKVRQARSAAAYDNLRYGVDGAFKCDDCDPVSAAIVHQFIADEDLNIPLTWSLGKPGYAHIRKQMMCDEFFEKDMSREVGKEHIPMLDGCAMNIIRRQLLGDPERQLAE